MMLSISSDNSVTRCYRWQVFVLIISVLIAVSCANDGAQIMTTATGTVDTSTTTVDGDYKALLSTMALHQSTKQMKDQLKKNVHTNNNNNAVASKIETTSQGNNNRTVVIHIGPLKTGSSTIQAIIREHRQVLLDIDHYDVPITGGIDAYIDLGGLRDCYWPRSPRPCHTGQINRISEIGSTTQNNLLITAESFSFPNTDIENFQKLFIPYWDNQIVVVYYRRFYDWLYSSWNQLMKLQSFDTRIDFVTYTRNMYYYVLKTKNGKILMSNQIEETFTRNLYTYASAPRWKKYFNTVKIYNVHDEESISNTEKFFCDAVPYANATCNLVRITENARREKRRARGISSKNNEERKNKARDLIYEDIVGEAIRMNWIESIDVKTLPIEARPLLDSEGKTNLLNPYQQIASKVQYQHEHVWNKTKYDFIEKLCLEDEIIQYLLDKTLLAERELFPIFFSSPLGEEAIRTKFTADIPKKLCTVNARAELLNNPQWKLFFEQLIGRQLSNPLPSATSGTSGSTPGAGAADNGIGNSPSSTSTNTITFQQQQQLKLDHLQNEQQEEIQHGYANGIIPISTHVRSHISNNDRTVIIHIGPLKTGSSSIQAQIRQFRKTLLEQDYYEVPTVNKDLDMGGLRDCYWPDAPRPCNYSQIIRVRTIGKNTTNNLLISAESFSFPNTDIEQFETLFKRYWPNKNNQIVVIYYRRFYDWLHSHWNQLTKQESYNTRLSFVDYVRTMYNKTAILTTKDIDGIIPNNHLQETFSQGLYTYGLIPRWKQYFTNIKLYNVHDETTISNIEKFFCNAIPNAPITCQHLQEKISKLKLKNHHLDELRKNKSRDLIYDDIIHAAIQLNILPQHHSNNPNSIRTLSDKVQYQQEIIWKQTKYDLSTNPNVQRNCLDQHLLDTLLQYTLHAEQTLFPEYYNSPAGEQTIRKEFAIDSQTKLCSINAQSIIENNNQLADYLRTLN